MLGRVSLDALAVATVARPGPAQEGYFDRPLPEAYCGDHDPRREVLLLGSYHTSNPGADQFNLEADDVLLPERQAEKRAVVDALEAFAPTHVLIEAPWRDSAAVSRNRAYAAGDGKLRRSEEEEIGFRIARARGLDVVHPIDVRMGLDFEAVSEVASQDPRLGRTLGETQAVDREAMRVMGEKLAQSSIGAMLRWMNEPEILEKAHIPYIEFFVPDRVRRELCGCGHGSEVVSAEPADLRQPDPGRPGGRGADLRRSRAGTLSDSPRARGSEPPALCGGPASLSARPVASGGHPANPNRTPVPRLT